MGMVAANQGAMVGAGGFERLEMIFRREFETVGGIRKIAGGIKRGDAELIAAFQPSSACRLA